MCGCCDMYMFLFAGYLQYDDERLWDTWMGLLCHLCHSNHSTWTNSWFGKRLCVIFSFPTKNVHIAFYSLWPVLKSTKLYYVLFLSPPKIKDYGLNVFVLFVFLSSKAGMLHQYSIFRAFLEHLFWNMILLFKDRVMLFLIDLIWLLCIFFPKIEIQFFH